MYKILIFVPYFVYPAIIFVVSTIESLQTIIFKK